MEPRGIPSGPSSKTQKARSAFRPQEAARCRHASHAARIAMPSAVQAGRPAAPSVAFGDGGSAVSACRRFPDQESPPAALLQALFLSAEEPHRECSRMLPPGVPNAPSSAAPQLEQLNACPIIIPGSSAAKDTRGHTRRQISPRASQPGCSCTLCRDNRFVWIVHHHTNCPRRDPGLSAPKRKRCSQKPDAILTGSGCTGLSLRRYRVAAACRLR